MRHRKWSLRALALVMAATGATVVAGSPAEAATTKIMVVGDSISQGTEGDYTWRYRLSEHLAASNTAVDFVGPWTGTRVLNADHANQTISHNGAYRPGISFDSANLAQWGWQMHQAKDVIGAQVQAYAPDYLLVELGFNDLGWGINGPAGVLNDLEWFIYHARAVKPDINIVVSNVPHRTPLAANPNLPAMITEYNNLLAARVPRLSTELSTVAMTDLDGPFDENRDAYDGLHPNVRGEYVIAEAFADRLSGMFGLGLPMTIPSVLPAALTPGAPTSISATPVDDKIKVSWSHVFGATGYQFWQRDLTTGSAWQKGQIDIGADSWTADLLPAGHRLEFQVRTTRGTAHVSGASPTAAATVRAMPDVPNVRVDVDPGNRYAATVRWDPVAGADDYHVYSAPGCDLVPPAPSEFTLQQFNLGGKSSWTQTFLTDACVNYAVVASRYGGSGPIKFERIVRAWPYQNNPAFFNSKARYMDSAPDSGDVKARTAVRRTDVDRGMVVVRGFIKDNDWFTHAIGDRRGFDPRSHASAKIGVAWDTLTGDVGVYVHKSCVVGSDVPAPWEQGCKSALPVQFTPDATTHGDSDTSQRNYVSAALAADGTMRISVSAINSWSPGLGRINATIVLTPSGSTYSARLVGDRFPAWEIYHYPTAMQAPTPSGKGVTIGTRDQTQIEDLTSGVQSTCTSRAQTTDQFTVNPMICS